MSGRASVQPALTPCCCMARRWIPTALSVLTAPVPLAGNACVVAHPDSNENHKTAIARMNGTQKHEPSGSTALKRTVRKNGKLPFSSRAASLDGKEARCPGWAQADHERCLGAVPACTGWTAAPLSRKAKHAPGFRVDVDFVEGWAGGQARDHHHLQARSRGGMSRGYESLHAAEELRGVGAHPHTCVPPCTPKKPGTQSAPCWAPMTPSEAGAALQARRLTSPHTAISQPAPAATRTSRTLKANPEGAPLAAGSLLRTV